MQKHAQDCVLDIQSFQKLADVAYAESGLQLVPEKTPMIQSRLRKRLRVLGVQSFDEYSALICSPDGKDERQEMLSALTTNVSHFFRESHHFDLMRQRVLSSILPAPRSNDSLRIWSAGSSNGQEAYSIAMTLIESVPQIFDLDVRVLATDINRKVVEFADHGVYPEHMMNGVSSERRRRFFERTVKNGITYFKCNPCLRQLTCFKTLNLLSEWPMKRPMDFIFCRNVVIYFDAKTQDQLWHRFRRILSPDGLLFLGHSERIPNTEATAFFNFGPTTYTTIAPGEEK